MGYVSDPQYAVWFSPSPSSFALAAALTLPTARHGLTAQVIGERFYVIGGGPEARLSTSLLVEIFAPGA